jgi:hypothetical protein
MALSTFIPTGAPPGVVAPQLQSDARLFNVRLKGDSSYPTGGSALSASLLGVSNIIAVSAGLSESGTYLAQYLPASGLLKVMSALGTEVVNLTSLAAEVFPLVVIGKAL